MSDTTTNTSANPQRPEWLAQKFFDPQTGEIRVESLARSYNELERVMGAQAKTQERTEGPGLPATPDAYELDVDDLLDVDPEVNQRLHAAGFSNEQAQLVYDLASERLVPMMQRMTTDADDTQQLERVIKHFGSPENFAAVRQQLRAWGQANLSPEVFNTLASSAEGVIAIHTMMQSDEPGLGGVTGQAMGSGEGDLKRIMADPRYWRERDPTFVSRVREGFRQLYPDA